MWRKVFDVLFWLAVAVYFGGMLTLGAVAAPVIFSAAHDAKLTMPGIAAPPLDMGNQVGGEVFGVILNRFAFVEWAATAVILIALAGWFRVQKPIAYTTWVIALLWAGLAGIVAYDSIAVRPAVFKQREVVRQAAAAQATMPATSTATAASVPAASPSGAGADSSPVLIRAQTDFDTLHTESEDLGRYKVYLLLGMILIGAVYGGGSGAGTATPEEPAPPPQPAKKKKRELLDP